MAKEAQKLQIIPLGGLGEIGKNFINWAISRPKDISDTALRSIDKTMSKGHGKYVIPKARWHESAAQVDVFSMNFLNIL